MQRLLRCIHGMALRELITRPDIEHSRRNKNCIRVRLLEKTQSPRGAKKLLPFLGHIANVLHPANLIDLPDYFHLM